MATLPGRTGNREGLLYELCCAFAERTELDELVPLVLAKCRESLDAEGASLLMLDAARAELYFPYVATEDAAAAEHLREMRFPADSGIAGAVLQDGRAIRIDDVASDPRFFRGVDRRTGASTRAMLSAPLRGRTGAIGVLQAINPLHGGSFTEEDLAFFEALAAGVSIALENAGFYRQLRDQVARLEKAVEEHNELLALRRELQIARDIQQSIIPRVFPAWPARTDFEIFASMLMASELGGDFYDFFLLDDDHLAVVIGDVVGKGVPAALFMAVTRTLLRSAAMTKLSPAACLAQVNRLLCLENDQGMFVTLFYGILDTSCGEFAYANAGHNPPWLLRPGAAPQAFAATGDLVLGGLDIASYREHRVQLAPGDGILLFTDGVTEGMNTSECVYSDARLAALLGEAGDLSSAKLVAEVVASVQQHGAGRHQSDDMTVMALRYHGQRGEP
jgi:serine phosphatase RsbU (regulator of sigma subunit)